MNDKLTVLIPTRNRGADLRNSLGRMKECGLDNVRYIIYDDASDNIAETIEASQIMSQVTVLQGESRIGQAGGRNALLRACLTPYAVFMDDDCWFTKADKLAEIIARDLKYEGVGHASIVCSQVFRTYDGETLFPNDLQTCRILNPIGMGCIVRVSDILKVGAFREYWRYRHEEPELGLRLWKNDLSVVYDSSLVVEHCHSSAARSSREYEQNSARNLILLHVLNLPGFAGMPLGIMRALRLLLIKDYSKMAVLKGLAEGILDSFRHSDDVMPMSSAQYKALCIFKRDLRNIFGK